MLYEPFPPKPQSLRDSVEEGRHQEEAGDEFSHPDEHRFPPCGKVQSEQQGQKGVVGNFKDKSQYRKAPYRLESFRYVFTRSEN